MFGWVKKLFRQAVTWFKPNEGVEPFTLPLHPPPPLLTPKSQITPTIVAEPPQQNRATRRALDRERRKYERARMKHDKLVTPGGETPIKVTRVAAAKPALKLVTPEPAVADHHNEFFVGELIEGDGTRVMFEQSEVFEFNFRDSILDQLDRYWTYLERMKKRDPDSYGFYKILGAVLVPRLGTGMRWKPRDDKKMTPEEIEEYKSEIVLPPWFKQQRPTFGCIAIGVDPLTEQREKEMSSKRSRIHLPRFVYFTKYDQPPPELQPMAGGDIYKMTVWWDDLKHESGPSEFGVFISRDGNTVQVLRMLSTRMVSVKRKRKLEWFKVPQRNWRIPESYEHWAQERGLDASTFLAHLFCTIVAHLEQTDYSMVRVRVTKTDLAAVFGVNVERLAYFFRDRDIELTEGGLKKRIFHLVRPHIRADGIAIKMHFRGLAEFDWAGYHVKITVPGRDHFTLSQVDIGFSDDYWAEDKKEKMIDTPKFGKMLHEWMEEGKTFKWRNDS